MGMDTSKYSDDLVDTIRQFVAETCVDATVLRNQGEGVCRDIISYLGTVDLAALSSISERGFPDWLDEQTDGMLRSLKVKDKPWGTARKALNIFLRSALYNHFLRAKYDLERLERAFEVPLDSKVAERLGEEFGCGALDPWPGLKDLQSKQSTQFQQFAQTLADRRGLPARVYLDNYLWMGKP